MNSDNCVELFIIVRCAHNADSTKISHSADSSTSFASESQRNLLNLSTNPFACDRYGVDRWCFTRNFSVSFFTTSFTNSVLLFVCRCVKHPNRQIIFWYRKLDILKALASVTAFASCHLDKYSTATIIYRFLFGVISNGPTTSTSHQSKNLDGGIRCRS